jgi:AcrR family transcriptional regulator
MELFLEQGYESTTVAQIAQRAGLTPRTFFRYFADKKEVLFAGTEVFETLVIEGVRTSQVSDPLERLVGAFEALAPLYFDARAEAVRLRRAVIESSSELQEREHQKMVRIGNQVADLLAGHGTPPSKARFAADLGVLVFRTAFARWTGSSTGTLTDQIRSTLVELGTLVGRD